MSRTIRLDAVLVQAVIAGALSFSHLHDLAEAAGQDGWKAWAYPISVDLLLVAAWRRMRTHADNRPAWVWFVIALTASLGANIATAGMLDLGDVPPWLRILVAYWPALAFLGGTLLAHTPTAPAETEPAPTVAPLTTPVADPAPAVTVERAPEPAPDPAPELPCGPGPGPGPGPRTGPVCRGDGCSSSAARSRPEGRRHPPRHDRHPHHHRDPAHPPRSPRPARRRNHRPTRLIRKELSSWPRSTSTDPTTSSPPPRRWPTASRLTLARLLAEEAADRTTDPAAAARILNEFPGNSLRQED